MRGDGADRVQCSGLRRVHRNDNSASTSGAVGGGRIARWWQGALTSVYAHSWRHASASWSAAGRGQKWACRKEINTSRALVEYTRAAAAVSKISWHTAKRALRDWRLCARCRQRLFAEMSTFSLRCAAQHGRRISNSCGIRRTHARNIPYGITAEPARRQKKETKAREASSVAAASAASGLRAASRSRD